MRCFLIFLFVLQLRADSVKKSEIQSTSVIHKEAVTNVFKPSLKAEAPAKITTWKPTFQIHGTKEVEWNQYKHKGDFNQFVQNNPQVLTDRQLDQRTRVEVSGEIKEGVSVDAVFDDSALKDDDAKILMNIRGDDFEMALGRIGLELEDTRYVLNNKKALGIYYSQTDRKLKSSFILARSEGVQEREQFFGQGVQREYVLKKSPVVPGSEKITLDGKRLVPNQDYRMDYEGGSIQIELKLLPIEKTSNLIVEYESQRDGAAFKNRIYGLREVYRPDLRSRIGFSFAGSKDQVSRDLIQSLNQTPEELLIFGLDGQVTGRNGLEADFEIANSTRQMDLASHSLPDKSDAALHLGLKYVRDGHTFVLSKDRIEPEFRSIGKDGFLAQGEDGNLLGDIDQNMLNWQYQDEDLHLSEVFENSVTNLNNDPKKDKTRFQRIGGDAQGKVLEKLSLRAGYRNENRPRYLDSLLQEYVTLRKQNVGAAMPISSALKADLSREDEERASIGTKKEDFKTHQFQLSSTKSKRFGWNYGYSQREGEDALRQLDTEKAVDHSLQLNYRKNTLWQAQIELLQRKEDFFLNREEISGGASGVDLRYTPNQKLEYSFKLRDEQKKRTVKESTNLDVVYRQNQDQKTYIEPLHPVNTLTSSQALRYAPSGRVTHRLNYRWRNEEEEVVNRLLSENRDYNYDGRFELRQDLRLKYAFDWQDRQNLAAALNKLTKINDFEVTRNLSEKWLLSSRLNQSHEEDYIDRQFLKSFEKAIRADKTINTQWKAYSSINTVDRKGREENRDLSLGLGAVYTPLDSDLRLSADLSGGQSKDRRTRQNSDIHKIQLAMQKQILKDARMEGSYKYEQEAPSYKGTGYSGSLVNLKVSMDF